MEIRGSCIGKTTSKKEDNLPYQLKVTSVR